MLQKSQRLPPSYSNWALKPHRQIPRPQPSGCQQGLPDSLASWSQTRPPLTPGSIPVYLSQHPENTAKSPPEASQQGFGVPVPLQCHAQQLPREHRSAGRVHEEHQARLMGPRSRHHQPGGGNSAQAIRKLLQLIPWIAPMPHSQWHWEKGGF